jgi:hypothetical protein
MKKSDIDSILLMNKYLAVNKSNHDCCYFLKRIINSKINSTITGKTNFSLVFWILGFIFVDRSGLWS